MALTVAGSVLELVTLSAATSFHPTVEDSTPSFAHGHLVACGVGRGRPPKAVD